MTVKPHTGVQERAEEVAAYFVDFLLARVSKALEVRGLLRRVLLAG